MLHKYLVFRISGTVTRNLRFNFNMKGRILRQTCYFAVARFPFYVVLNNAAILREATPFVPSVAYMNTMASFLKLDKTAKLVLLTFGTNSCND